MDHNKKSVEFESAFKMVKEAYEAGEVKIRRCTSYRSKKAKQGHIFYQIKFRNTKQWIYNGAYELSLSAETILKAEDKLTQFLLIKLTQQLHV